MRGQQEARFRAWSRAGQLPTPLRTEKCITRGQTAREKPYGISWSMKGKRRERKIPGTRKVTDSLSLDVRETASTLNVHHTNW